MSQPQTNLTIAAPGFGGLNTQLAQTEQPDTFAAVADNCVIDSYGRVGARKGFSTITTSTANYNGNDVSNIYQFIGEDGTTKVFTTAGNNIYAYADVPIAQTFATPVAGQAISLARTENGEDYAEDGIFSATTSLGSAPVAGYDTITVSDTGLTSANTTYYLMENPIHMRTDFTGIGGEASTAGGFKSYSTSHPSDGTRMVVWNTILDQWVIGKTATDAEALQNGNPIYYVSGVSRNPSFCQDSQDYSNSDAEQIPAASSPNVLYSGGGPVGGSGVTFDVTVIGGVVTAQTRTADGSGYVVGDVLTLVIAGNEATTPAKYTVATVSTAIAAAITDDNWKMMSLNNNCYFIQAGHTPKIYDHDADTYVTDSGIMPRASTGLSAFGRLWLSNTGTDNHSVVYYSTRLDGTDFDLNSSGDNGSFNCAEFWPTGYDEVQALAAHNGRLVIFGKDNILIYAQADGDPAASKNEGGIFLEDSIRGIGCISRDSVQSTGKDVVFLDHTGLRSLARVIQERSMPVGDVSGNIRTELSTALQGLISTDRVRSLYLPEEQLYILIGSGQGTVLAFNTAQIAPDGAMRVTRWPFLDITGATTHDGTTLFSDSVKGVTEYTGYDDDGDSYKMKYFTHFLSFGDSTRLKIPKRIALTMLVGQVEELRLYWGFDYKSNYSSSIIALPAPAEGGQYGVSEYSLCEYTGGVNMIREAEQAGGNGYVLQVGVEVDIFGEQFSLQEINIQTLIGRLV